MDPSDCDESTSSESPVESSPESSSDQLSQSPDELLFESSDELKDALASSFEAVDGDGSFAAQGCLGDANPGLDIEGLGSFGIPLSEPGVSRIIAESRQAPFGKGSDTIVDTSVRKTWEIDASRIKLRHPLWLSREQKMLPDVCEQLGIPVGSDYVRAELYKLLVYSEGAMFKPHKDTKKSPGMFGTLVVCLPSTHTGGDVHLSFNGKTKLLSTAPTSKWLTSYLAWYGDVLHEVKPVLSGYRVVLTYNLVHTRQFSISIPQYESEALRSVLRKWTESAYSGEDVQQYLVYLLEHEYTEHSLRLDELKGKDLGRVRYLESILEETGFCCALASLEREIRGSYEEDEEIDYRPIDEVLDDEIVLKRVVALDGSHLLSNIKVEDGDIVQDDPFDGRVPDDEEYLGYTRNAGATATHWYRNSALVVLPRACWMDLKLKPLYGDERSRSSFPEDNYRIDQLLNAEVGKLNENVRDEQVRTDVTKICNFIINGNKSALERLHKHPSQGGRTDLFGAAVAATSGEIPQQLFEELPLYFQRHTFARLREGLLPVIYRPETSYEVRISFCLEMFQAMEAGGLGREKTTSTRNVARAVLQQYVARVVRAELIIHRDWSRQPRGCGCPDCVSLDRFLVDRNAKIHRLSTRDVLPRHVERRLPGEKRAVLNPPGTNVFSDYTTRTERTGSPHTLVIEKTVDSHRKARDEWLQRIERANTQITAIAQPTDLREILNDAYDCFAPLSPGTFPQVLAVARAESRNFPTLGQPLAPLSNPPAPATEPATGSHPDGAGAAPNSSIKRKNGISDTDVPFKRARMTEVIDLSGSP